MAHPRPTARYPSIASGLGRVAVVATMVLLAATTAHAGRIYWSESGSRQIRRSDLEGQGVQLVFDVGRTEWVGEIDVAAIAASVYWSTFADFGGELRRVRLDGTGMDPLASGAAAPGGIQVDLAATAAYYAQPSDCSPGCASVRRIDLDGAADAALFRPDAPQGIAVDAAAGRVYWSDLERRWIRHARLDGSDDRLYVSDVIAYGFAIDVAGGKIYWTERTPDRICRGDLGGGGIEILVSGRDDPWGIALDPARGKMYWAETGGGTIVRANLDGTQVEELLAGLDAPVGIALELGEGVITMAQQGDDLTWTGPVGASTFDVVRGDLSTLRATAGDFAAATDACLVAGLDSPGATFAGEPGAGEGSWFLVRGVTVTGDGTYTSFGLGQSAHRDASIAASGVDCGLPE